MAHCLKASAVRMPRLSPLDLIGSNMLATLTKISSEQHAFDARLDNVFHCLDDTEEKKRHRQASSSYNTQYKTFPFVTNKLESLTNEAVRAGIFGGLSLPYTSLPPYIIDRSLYITQASKQIIQKLFSTLLRAIGFHSRVALASIAPSVVSYYCIYNK